MGSFHPLLVHLPIGILLLTACFEWLSRNDRFASLQPAIPMMLYAGAGSAVLSCMSGWILADSGEYSSAVLDWHRYLGIATAALALAACLIPWRRLWLTLCAGALIGAGHYGGSLTHGEDYLWSGFSPRNTPVKRAAIADIQSAQVYRDLVAPVLEEKCSGCHNASKQKGGLRLDAPEWIQKGGKNGPVLGPATKSALLERIDLPLSHDDHMPPKEKTQLTEAEKILLHWWIEQGADFEKTAGVFAQSELVKNALNRLAQGEKASPPAALPEVPGTPVEAAPATLVAALSRQGVSILPVAQNNHYLSANFVNVLQPSDSLMQMLVQLAPQLVWLKLSGTTLSPQAWAAVGKLSALTRLHLDRSNCSDADLAQLSGLKNLQFLNLSRTAVSARGLQALQSLPQLRRLHLYQTGIGGQDREILQAALPAVRIDSGGYAVPTLPSDTTRLKSGR